MRKTDKFQFADENALDFLVDLIPRLSSKPSGSSQKISFSQPLYKQQTTPSGGFLFLDFGRGRRLRRPERNGNEKRAVVGASPYGRTVCANHEVKRSSLCQNGQSRTQRSGVSVMNDNAVRCQNASVTEPQQTASPYGQAQSVRIFAESEYPALLYSKKGLRFLLFCGIIKQIKP